MLNKGSKVSSAVRKSLKEQFDEKFKKQAEEHEAQRDASPYMRKLAEEKAQRE